MLRRFSRIATYAMVLSCCFVTYSCDGGQNKQAKDNEEEINRLKRQVSDLQDEVYNLQNNSRPTQSTSRPLNIIAGHEYVDLGLSVKWATCNVGASSPSDYGNYYAWGETRTKSEYTINNCSTEKSMGDIAENANYDAARANWGGTWRLPTKDEIQELINKCKRTWTTQGGHYGYKITGPNGNSIFLPAAGYRVGTSLDDAGEGGYWSSSPDESFTQVAYGLDFDSGSFHGGWSSRFLGQSVRPVTK